MFIAYVVVTVIATIANGYAAANDFIRPKWLLANMTKLGVRESWLTKLGLLKAAGALGVLVGIRVPLIGVAAAVGLILFFAGAIITHLRSRLLLSRYANRIPSAGHRRTITGTICAGAGRVCARGEVAWNHERVRTLPDARKRDEEFAAEFDRNEWVNNRQHEYPETCGRVLRAYLERRRPLGAGRPSWTRRASESEPEKRPPGRRDTRLTCYQAVQGGHTGRMHLTLDRLGQGGIRRGPPGTEPTSQSLGGPPRQAVGSQPLPSRLSLRLMRSEDQARPSR